MNDTNDKDCENCNDCEPVNSAPHEKDERVNSLRAKLDALKKNNDDARAAEKEAAAARDREEARVRDALGDLYRAMNKRRGAEW